MARQNLAFLAFNRGLISTLALARIDLKRMALSATTMVNWIARTLGSMMLRPGLGYIGATYTNATARYLPFVFSISDKALVELTAAILRIWISDALITRVAVSTAVTNGTFPTNFASWTDDDEAGATSAWISAGLVGFTGNGTAYAIRTQQVTVAAADQNVEHALRIVVARGPLILLVGSTSGGDEYIRETTLGTGTHSLAFTPTGDFYIRFKSALERIVHLSQCTVEAAGVMTLPTPWAAVDLGLLRYDQSGDILFVASGKTTDTIGYQQYKIERRATRSWSVVKFEPENGPFRTPNVSPTTMTSNVLAGNGTLTASVAFFRTTHVGALFALTVTGQSVTKSAAALNDATASIIVDETGANRAFLIIITGVTAGRTVILEYSLDNSVWVAVAGKSWTADTSEAYTDGLDNQIIYYRLRVSVAGGAGTTTLNLTIGTGSTRGICRVTSYSSTTVANIEVLTSFGGTAATDDWEEGQWSDRRGWPGAVGFYEGRLWWAGQDAFVGSASDDFVDYDATAEGDSASINRTIGSGPVDTINWLLPLLRLIGGGAGAEFSARSTTFDEPLTPSNFNLKRASTQGSARVNPVIVDDTGVYVQRGGSRVFELAFDGNKYDYTSSQLSLLIPSIGSPGITRVAVQRQPDTRVHFVRSDGTVALLVYDRAEDVRCWLEVEAGGTDASIEDVVVLPGDSGSDEDQVYYVVARTVNGSTVRYLERWALESQSIGATVSRCADSYVTFTNGSPSTTVSGLTHLIGATVIVWQDGVCPEDADGDPKTYTVSGGGTITLDTAATTGVVGLAYRARWRSAKLAQLQAQLGTPLNQMKTINGLGIVAVNLHPKGLKVGQDFDNMDDMPSVEEGAIVDTDAVWDEYDGDMFIFPGKWTTDARLCLEANAPRPATVLAAVAAAHMNE